MLITDYTTYAEIRAVLGVSTTELPDTVLAQEQYATMLTLDLEDINTGIPALYTTVSATPEINRTTNEQRFYELARLTAAYAIARNLLTSLPLFSVSRLTDGRAEFERQKDIFEDVRNAVNAMYDKLRARLSAIFVILVPGQPAYTAVTQTFTAATGLATDPVTGE